MIKKSLVSLAIICLLMVVFWFSSSNAKKFISDIGPLISAISSLLALTVFLQFYNEIQKSKKNDKEKQREIKAKLNSRMVALGSELTNNIQLCNLFESDKEANLKGTQVPNIYFEFSVIENMVISGDITSHKLRAELSSLMFQMKALNKLILSQHNLMVFKCFSTKDNKEDITLRIRTSMILFHTKIPLVKRQLIAAEPLFNEQWNNPEKFNDEDYLKKRMIPEALIR